MFVKHGPCSYLALHVSCVIQSQVDQTYLHHQAALHPTADLSWIFFYKHKSSIFDHIQAISRERGSASCLVWHMHAFVCSVLWEGRGEGWWRRWRKRRRVGSRRRKFVFAQRATQQQHSCDCQLRSYFNNINEQTCR